MWSVGFSKLSWSIFYSTVHMYLHWCDIYRGRDSRPLFRELCTSWLRCFPRVCTVEYFCLEYHVCLVPWASSGSRLTENCLTPKYEGQVLRLSLPAVIWGEQIPTSGIFSALLCTCLCICRTNYPWRRRLSDCRSMMCGFGGCVIDA